MKHTSLASFAITIIIATMCGAWISHNNAEEADIQRLLSSTATIDQLAGIEKIKHESFDSLVNRLSPLLKSEPIVANSACNALVQCAFRESCVHQLDQLHIHTTLLESAKWWNTKKTKSLSNPENCALACDKNASPWLRRLAALHCDSLDSECLDELQTMPLVDRDGSILLSTLALHKHSLSSKTSLWNTSIDIDQRKIFILLQGLAKKSLRHTDSDPTVQHISKILTNKNGILAWRSMHLTNGLIDPDIFLSGLIVDQVAFLQLLVESAQANLWQHPEHPVELARIFVPEITSVLPESLLLSSENRVKWWNLFACGLLIEER